MIQIRYFNDDPPTNILFYTSKKLQASCCLTYLKYLQIAGQEDLKRGEQCEKSDNDVAWSEGVEVVEQITNNYWTCRKV